MAKAIKKTNRTSEIKKPSGADEIKTAFLSASNILFGQKGPDAVTVRDIAAEAGLMPTLVHRYFGSKDELIRQVVELHIGTFQRAAGDITNPQAVVKSMFDVMEKHPAFLRIIAYTLLGGHEPSEYLSKKGMVSKLSESLADVGVKNAKLEAAIAASRMAGWLLLEPFFLYASGYDGTKEEARAAVVTGLLASLPEPSAPFSQPHEQRKARNSRKQSTSSRSPSKQPGRA